WRRNGPPRGGARRIRQRPDRQPHEVTEPPVEPARLVLGPRRQPDLVRRRPAIRLIQIGRPSQRPRPLLKHPGERHPYLTPNHHPTLPSPPTPPPPPLNTPRPGFNPANRTTTA